MGHFGILRKSVSVKSGMFQGFAPYSGYLTIIVSLLDRSTRSIQALFSSVAKKC